MTRPPQRMLSVMSSPPCLRRGRVSGRDFGYCSLSTSTKIRSKGPGTARTPCKGILGRSLKGEEAAVGRKRPRNPVGRIAKARPHFQDALCPDELGELGQDASDDGPNDGEVTRLGEPLHLCENRIPVRNEAVKVGLDIRSQHAFPGVYGPIKDGWTRPERPLVRLRPMGRGKKEAIQRKN